MSRHARAFGVVLATLLVATLLVAGCSGGSNGKSSGSTTTTKPPVAIRAPRGDLYQPPADMRRADPGTLIWARLFAQRVSDPVLFPGATIWQMLYHSRDQAGHDIAVSGFAVVPTRHAPAGGREVFAWAHGLVGLGDRCAPSKAIRDNVPPYGRQQVQHGAVLVATDYQGLGTPGDNPYLVGEAEGHDVLDSVRAAASLPDVGTIGRVVVAGSGQGGHAALWAAQIARDYAPELQLQGVVAIAPAAELATTVSLIARSHRRLGLLVITAAGLHAGYHDFDPRSYLTPAAATDLTRVQTECVAATLARYRGRAINSVIQRGPNTIRSVHNLLVANSPGGETRVPILILQGERDTETPARLTARLQAKYCAGHAAVTRKVYAAANERGLSKAAQTDALRWINDRYRNRRAPSNCK
jgi:acetyl esterase/lipase